MVRPKRLGDNARQTSISFTPAEMLVIAVIAQRRISRLESRHTQSEIVSDALWRLLEDVEKVPRSQIERLLPPKLSQAQSNVEAFPKRTKT
jgi:hypothetical protein